MLIRNTILALVIVIPASLLAQPHEESDKPILITPKFDLGIDTNEVYPITKSRIKTLPTYHPLTQKAPLSIERAKQLAIKYVNENEEYPQDLDVYEICLQHFSLQDSERGRLKYKMWVYLVYFLHDHGIGMVVVPVLLDGTIVKPSYKQ